ncbi:Ubiquitin carboxyl-terminal hydrolase 24 [Datura stramonium]|uniref:Ubiquitin carboxyl-terminal hydrolase 24 n=1 Tax=Datura stramonium TaxID=4076 RepID=A0ABS8RU89_DATST|nr:Ubiquitin carboxyl-terminal hydrolase 24 [Datura stramonium]
MGMENDWIAVFLFGSFTEDETKSLLKQPSGCDENKQVEERCWLIPQNWCLIYLLEVSVLYLIPKPLLQRKWLRFLYYSKEQKAGHENPEADNLLTEIKQNGDVTFDYYINGHEGSTMAHNIDFSNLCMPEDEGEVINKLSSTTGRDDDALLNKGDLYGTTNHSAKVHIQNRPLQRVSEWAF